jgi:hypothetical protein
VNTEKRSSQRTNTLLQQDRAGTQCRAGTGDLNTEAVLRDTYALELTGIGTGMLEGQFVVVGIRREGLEKDPALDVVDICL